MSAERASAADRLRADLAQLERLAPSRLAWGAEWQRACEWLAQGAREVGADFESDPAGNQWFSVGARGAGGPVVVGGYLDTAAPAGLQGEPPSAGALSLLVGLELLRSPPPGVRVRVVNWSDGAGVRFGRPFGASAASGRLRDWYVAEELRDAGGTSLRECTQALGIEPRLSGMARRALLGTRAYLELGLDPALAGESTLVAAHAVAGVERCRLGWGVGWPGSEAQASAAAARFAAELPGRLEPGGTLAVGAAAPTGHAGALQLLELRHGDAAALEIQLERALELSDALASEAGLAVEWQRLWATRPVELDGVLAERARSVAGVPRSALESSLQCAASELARGGIPALLVLAAPAQALRAGEAALGTFAALAGSFAGAATREA